MKWKLGGDLIIVGSILKRLSNVNPDDYFGSDRSNITRNNGNKIIGKLFKTNEGKYFFFY